jgi:uncharacterized protein YabE (DUF348 family)
VKNTKLKCKIFLSIFSLVITVPGFFNIVSAKNEELNFESVNKTVKLNEDGLIFEINTQAQTIKDFLNEQKVNLKNEDLIFPDKDSKIYSGSSITIQKAKNVVIIDGKNKISGLAFGNNAASALWENKITLGEDDIVTPDVDAPISDSSRIEIIRVDIKEEAVTKDIDFKKVSEEDGKLSWRMNKIKQKGVKGKEEIKYRVVAHNSQEISRKIIERNTIQDPVPEITVQGTYMKLGKASTGDATWYAFTGTMAAANPWLPLGTYVKVTNQDNGKSVVVKINDRGPFGNGRILDLDKVAFAKIADIGAGVANVKMEVVLN